MQAQLMRFEEVSISAKPALDQSLRSDFTTSAKTAIFRSGASAPVKVLLDKQMFAEGSGINFGKGKYDFDTSAIAQQSGHCVGYDYTYNLDLDLLGSSYDNLYSGYVVNTLPPKARDYVWHQMAECVRGIAFVAARTDKIPGIEFEDGVLTSINTFQKSYRKGLLVSEASNYFEHVVEIKGKAGFSIVACSHYPLPERVLKHSK